MKILVVTKNILLLGLNGDVYEPDRPSLVSPDSFCQSKIAAGVVSVLKSDLPDEATDAQWLKFYKDSDKDVELAYEAFKAKYAVEGDVKADADALDAQEPLTDGPVAQVEEPAAPAQVEEPAAPVEAPKTDKKAGK